VRFEPATGDVRLSAVVIESDDTTGHARSIQRIMLSWVKTCHGSTGIFTDRI